MKKLFTSVALAVAAFSLTGTAQAFAQSGATKKVRARSPCAIKQKSLWRVRADSQ